MLKDIPTLAPCTHAHVRRYELERPPHVLTTTDAAFYIKLLLARRSDVVLAGLPVLGRDRHLRPVISVQVLPAGARPIALAQQLTLL